MKAHVTFERRGLAWRMVIWHRGWGPNMRVSEFEGSPGMSIGDVIRGAREWTAAALRPVIRADWMNLEGKR